MFVRVKTLPHVTNDEQLDKALYAWFIQQTSTGKPISGESKTFLRAVKRGAYCFLYSLFLHYCLINIHIFDYSAYFVQSQRVRIIEVRL